MKKRILCYGDSNTWGHTPGTGERYDEETRWPMVAQKDLGEEYLIIEEAISGRTTVYDREHDDDLNGKKGLGYAVKAQKPLDCIVISLGVNDIIEHSAMVSMRGMEELARIARNANTYYRPEGSVFPHGAKVLLLGLPALHPIVDEMGPLDTPYHGKYKESLLLAEAGRRVADKLGIDYLDISSLGEASPVDGVHFTPESHRKIGKAVAEKLKAMFED